MTRREFFGVSTAGLAIIAALAGTPFRVSLDNNELRISGPLHRVCRLSFNGIPVKSQKKGIFFTSFDISDHVAGLEGPGLLKVRAPISAFDWTMMIHPFEPGF